MPKMGIKASPSRHPKPSQVRTPATTLSDALFSGTQQRVLGLLFGQPHRSFFATELINLVGAGSGGVQRELKRLTDSGLVTAQRIGNQRHFQANPDSPLFAPLRDIVMKTTGLAQPLVDALAPLADRILAACVYGSVAKGVVTASSDIDLLVISDQLTLEALYKVLEPVEKQLARPINPTLYTKGEFSKRRRAANPFVTKVLAGELLPIIGDVHAVV
jgi:predicted nucleotidyltransferase